MFDTGRAWKKNSISIDSIGRGLIAFEFEIGPFDIPVVARVKPPRCAAQESVRPRMTCILDMLLQACCDSVTLVSFAYSYCAYMDTRVFSFGFAECDAAGPC